MKKVYLLVVFLIGMFLVPVTATAIVSREDLTTMGPEVAYEVLLKESKVLLKESKKESLSPNEWVGLAERLGRALSALAAETGMALNEFAKTPVGILAIAILMWKTIGVSIIAGLVWVVSLIVIIWSFRHFHVPARVVDQIKEDGKIIQRAKYEPRYAFFSNDAKSTSACAHTAMFIAINIMLIVAIALS